MLAVLALLAQATQADFASPAPDSHYQVDDLSRYADAAAAVSEPAYDARSDYVEMPAEEAMTAAEAIPPTIPAITPSPPRPIATPTPALEFDRGQLPPIYPADTRRPAQRKSESIVWLVAIITGIFALASADRWAPFLKGFAQNQLRRIAPTPRHGAALLVSLGLAVVLIDTLLLDDLDRVHGGWLEPILNEIIRYHSRGWISFVGGAAAVIGFYRWLTVSAGSEI